MYVCICMYIHIKPVFFTRDFVKTCYKFFVSRDDDFSNIANI